jgi:membrane protein implicated in regulation of membrane protease activity
MKVIIASYVFVLVVNFYFSRKAAISWIHATLFLCWGSMWVGGHLSFWCGVVALRVVITRRWSLPKYKGLSLLLLCLLVLVIRVPRVKGHKEKQRRWRCLSGRIAHFAMPRRI